MLFSKKEDSYVNYINLNLFIQKLNTLGENLTTKEKKEELREFFKKFYENSIDYKKLTNNSLLDIDSVVEKTIENNIVFLRDVGLLKLGLSDLNFSVDFIENFKIEKKYNTNATIESFFQQTLKEIGISFAYNNKLLLLPSTEKVKNNLNIQTSIIDNNLLDLKILEKFIKERKEEKNLELSDFVFKLYEESKNLSTVKRKLADFLLQNKSFKNSSIGFNDLNFLKWCFYDNKIIQNNFLEKIKFNSIENKTPVLLEEKQKIKLYSIIATEKELIEKLKNEMYKKINATDEEFEKVKKIISDEYILNIVKTNYNGNFIDFFSELLNEELDPIDYSEMLNFKETSEILSNKIKSLSKNQNEKIVFVIDSLDMDGRSCETLCDIMKSEILKNNQNIQAKQIVVVPSLNPKNDERGFNLTTITHIFKNNLIEEGDNVTFITADNGCNNISSIKKIKEYAKENNFKVDNFLITDHHMVINTEIHEEENVYLCDQADEFNLHLFEGYNSCGAFLLKEIFKDTINKKNIIKQENEESIIKMFDIIGINANKADLVTSKERVFTNADIDSKINKMNAIFSSHNLYVLVAKYKDGEKSFGYVIGKIKELYSIDLDEQAEEVLNQVSNILDRTSNLSVLFKAVVLNEVKYSKQEIAASIIEDNNLPATSVIGDPIVYELIKIVLTSFSKSFYSEEEKIIFDEANDLISNIKNLEKQLLKHKGERLDKNSVEVLEVYDYKNILIIDIKPTTGEELSRKFMNKIITSLPGLKNKSDKEVVIVGSFNNGNFNGSIRTKGEISTFEVFHDLLKKDLANVFGHHNAAGVNILNIDSQKLEKIGKSINNSIGQKLRKINKGKDTFGYLISETRDLKIFNELNKITKTNSSPQNINTPILIKASEVVFKNPNDLKDDRFGLNLKNTNTILPGFYIASILFGEPEINILISSADLDSISKNDYLSLKQMSNGTFIVTAVGNDKYFNLDKYEKLEKNENTMYLDHGKEFEIEKIDEYTTKIDFEKMIRETRYYQYEKDKEKVELHLSLMKKLVEKFGVLNVLDLEANGLGRLSEIINVGVANLKFDKNKNLILENTAVFIKQKAIFNSIQNLCHIYQEDLEKVGVSIEEAKEILHKVMDNNKNGLFIAHNLLNFDSRVIESLLTITNYTSQMLDSMYPIRETKVAMDKNDSFVNVGQNNELLNGKFTLYNQNYTLEEFVNEVNNGKYLDVSGKIYLEKIDGNLYHLDKNTNIKTEIKKEEFSSKKYSIRTKSAVARMGKMQIIHEIRNTIEFDKKIITKTKQNVLKKLNWVIFHKTEKDFVNIKDYLSKDLKLEFSDEDLIENYDLEIGLEKNLSNLIIKIKEKNPNFDLESSKEFLSLLNDNLEKIHEGYLEELRVFEENPLLLYKYVNIDELLHCLELFNNNNNEDINVEKIKKYTNLNTKAINMFLDKLEPFKGQLQSFEETHNNTFNIYSDYIQEFYMLVVKTLLDKLPKDEKDLDKLFQLVLDYVIDSKSKYYYYRKHSEEFKPVSFNKMMFKQLLQQMDLKDNNSNIGDRLNILTKELRSGNLVLNVGKDRIFNINYKKHFDLNKLADMLDKKIPYNNKFIQEFYQIVKKIETLLKDKLDLETIERYFSMTSFHANNDKILDNNKNGRNLKILNKIEDFIGEGSPSYDIDFMKTIIEELKDKKQKYLLIQKIDEEIATLKEEDPKIKTLFEEKLYIYESLKDSNVKVSANTKLNKIETMIECFSNNILFLNSQNTLELFKNNIKKATKELKLLEEDIVEKNLDRKVLTKELILNNTLKPALFISLEKEEQLKVLNDYIESQNDIFEENDRIKHIEKIEDFLNINATNKDGSINQGLMKVKYGIQSILEGDKIRMGNTGGNIKDPISLLLKITKNNNINLKTIELLFSNNLEQATNILENNKEKTKKNLNGNF